MTDPMAEATRSLASPPADTTLPDVRDWLLAHRPALSRRWRQQLLARQQDLGDDVRDLLFEFVDLLVDLLADALGPQRELTSPVYRQAGELYGQFAAIRGLAAGEAVEEVQLLREALIRELFSQPPVLSGADLSLREVLRMNRFLDSVVTHTSVGHTDALFFALFRGSGVPDRPTEGLIAEVREQLDALRQELAEVRRD
ncbi:MAG: hypothetical protein D6701_01425 [Gemmatimonadetes bacterium]|nr:MAG: hypothetical protein D6701_01425 [Gemmatimonadota bacterium]